MISLDSPWNSIPSPITEFTAHPGVTRWPEDKGTARDVQWMQCWVSFCAHPGIVSNTWQGLWHRSINLTPQICVCKNYHIPFLHNPNQFLISTYILLGWWNNYPHCLLEFPLFAHTWVRSWGQNIGKKVAFCSLLISLHSTRSSTCTIPSDQQLSAVSVPSSGTGIFAEVACGPAETTSCKSVAWRLHLACRCALFGLGYVLKTF